MYLQPGIEDAPDFPGIFMIISHTCHKGRSLEHKRFKIMSADFIHATISVITHDLIFGLGMLGHSFCHIGRA